MRTVWRYELAGDENLLLLPPKSKLLNVAGLRGGVHAWFEVEFPDLERVEQHLLTVIPTGGTVPSGCRYVTTVILDPFAWHVYEALTPAIASRIVARDAEPVTT